MVNREIESNFGPSPENFTAGREVLWAFSPDQGSDQEPDYELSEEGKERLLDEIERRSGEHKIYSGKTPRRPKNERQKQNQWEPFNLEPNSNQRFVNLYGGPFSQQMELHRANVEKLLEVAGIQGQVILTDMPMDRSRGIAGVNSDGSVTQRRGLFWGEKLDEDESRTMVKKVSEGWKIEVPGQEIAEQLARQESKTALTKRFTNRLNQLIRCSIREIVIDEKLSINNFDQFFRYAITLGLPGVFAFKEYTQSNFDSETGISALMLVSITNYMLLNSVSITQKIFPPRYRSLIEGLEINRILRTIAFLNLKGRNLVRMKEEIS